MGVLFFDIDIAADTFGLKAQLDPGTFARRQI